MVERFKRPKNVTSKNFSMRINRWPVIEPERILADFGHAATRIIRRRVTSSGRDNRGKPLAAYSDVYRRELARAGEGARRDMVLSGELWRAFGVIRVTSKTVTLGWNASSRSPNTIRTHGGTRIGRGSGQRHVEIVARLAKGDGKTPPRPVLGLSPKDRRELSKWLKQRKRRFFRKR